MPFTILQKSKFHQIWYIRLYCTDTAICTSTKNVSDLLFFFFNTPGVADGQTVRMPVGTNELFVTFRVAKSNIFRRDGVDVHSDAVISFTQATLGGNVKIKGIYDVISLDVSI